MDLPDLPHRLDGVLIQGDTYTKGRHLGIPIQAAKKYECPVLTLWGNHELYHSSVEQIQKIEMEILDDTDTDVEVLNPGVRHIGDVRVIGCSLWTDLQLYPPLFLMAKEILPIKLNDYSYISVNGSFLTVEKMLSWHHRDREFLHEQLRRPWKGKTIVMTHHIPVRGLIAPHHVGDTDEKRCVNMGFASDLWNEFSEYKIDAWLCGHSHSNMRWIGQGKHGPIPFIMNQRGYPPRFTTQPNVGIEFCPTLTLDLGSVAQWQS